MRWAVLRGGGRQYIHVVEEVGCTKGEEIGSTEVRRWAALRRGGRQY